MLFRTMDFIRSRLGKGECGTTRRAKDEYKWTTTEQVDGGTGSSNPFDNEQDGGLATVKEKALQALHSICSGGRGKLAYLLSALHGEEDPNYLVERAIAKGVLESLEHHRSTGRRKKEQADFVEAILAGSCYNVAQDEASVIEPKFVKYFEGAGISRKSILKGFDAAKRMRVSNQPFSFTAPKTRNDNTGTTGQPVL
jgi:hypothetical protein